VSERRGLVAAVVGAVVAAAVVATGLSGCSAAPSAPDADAGPFAKPTIAIDSPAVTCGDALTVAPLAPSSTLWLKADGYWFDSGLVGSQTDTTVAVFVHQVDTGFCGWWPYAQYLAKHGVRSILLNLCGYGATVCATDALVLRSGAHAVFAAARWARTHGATRVVAVGASMGGTTVVLAASEDSRHELDAMADLSGPILYLDADTSSAAKKISIPSFFAVAPVDQVVSVSQMEALAGGIRSPKPIEHFDGSGHGWDLLHNGGSGSQYFDPLAEQLAAFIQGTPTATPAP
jgi:dienelactone hydrolase